MDNLKKFATEAEYSAATLNYPAVSWVVSGDTVHYDKEAPAPTVNDKVIIAAYDGAGEGKMYFFNCEASSSGDITSITLDNVAVTPISCQGDYVDAEQTYIIKYGLNTTQINDWLSGDLAVGTASAPSKLDVLIPSQITHIGGMPNNAENLVIEATTPPTTELVSSDFQHPVYVPDSALSAYQNDATWGEWGNYLQPISEYQGNLPV